MVVHWFFMNKCYDGLLLGNSVLHGGSLYAVDNDGNILFRGTKCRLYDGDCE